MDWYKLKCIFRHDWKYHDGRYLINQAGGNYNWDTHRHCFKCGKHQEIGNMDRPRWRFLTNGVYVPQLNTHHWIDMKKRGIV